MSTRGLSVVATRSLFQEGDGSSILTSPQQLKVIECQFEEISHIFERYPYKGSHMGGGISFCLALRFGDTIMGGAVIGNPRHERSYPGALDIRRLACKDEAPKNTESYFLSKIVWYVKKYNLADSLITYADPSVGHKGTIYRAANFTLVGETTESKQVFWKGKRYHPRSLSIERPYSHELREAVKRGEATIQTTEPKLVYEYKIKR